jgi:EAL and modified HD-GYP domain-containing signal transduction protein
LANGVCGDTQISSLSQAIIYLGEDLIRQFITVLALSELGQDKPSELTKLGLVRAKFINLRLEGQDHQLLSAGYLVGLVSVLDAVLDTQMDNIVKDFKLSDVCKQGLLGSKSLIGNALNLCKAIELDDWELIETQLQKEGINANQLAVSYTKALFYADDILDEIK